MSPRATWLLAGLVIILALVVTFTVSPWRAPPSSTPPGSTPPGSAPSDRLKAKLGEDTVSILTGATRCEAFLIDPEPLRETEPIPTDGKAIGGHRITETGPERSQEFAARLAAVLLTDETYNCTFPTHCFDPGVAFRLWNGDRRVEVLMCFFCDNLRFRAVGADGKELHEAFGNWMPSSRAKLVRLVKEAFPDNARIQAMPEKSPKFGSADR
jgi:hypothetical protein